MSTNGCIARRKGLTFEGRYHHWDSYPSGLGATLFRLYNGHFQRDADAMARYLVDDHPAGWSVIVKTDFALAPGFLNTRDFSTDAARRALPRPQCYCHGDRRERATMITSANLKRWGGVEWLYVIDGAHLFVYAVDSGTMRQVADVDMTGRAPDWDAMDSR